DGEAAAPDDVGEERVVPAGGLEEGGGEDGVEVRARERGAAHLLAHDRELDRPEPLPTRRRRREEAEIPHLGELPPRAAVPAARLVLHEPAALLERPLAVEEVARRAAQELLVLGEVELHRPSCGRLSTRLAMMFRWISDDPE